MPKVVCMGETMAMLTPTREVPLEDATELFYGVGGAESNVAMGLAAMGVTTAWVSRVGRDGFGTKILKELATQGVDVSGVQHDAKRPTGLYVKVPAGPAASEASVLYYRKGSAASAMGPELLAEPTVHALVADAALIHLSGITAALSPSCRDLLHAILAAPRAGRLISFDVNWRAALWAESDAGVLRTLADRADIVLVGADEALPVFGTNDEAALRALLPGPRVIVLKNADTSAVALVAGGERVEVPALRVEVLEPVGAGDAFAAGYLSGRLFGLDQRDSLRRGHVSAACTLTVPGDRGPLPAPEVLARILACSEAQWAATRVAPGLLSSPVLDGSRA